LSWSIYILAALDSWDTCIIYEKDMRMEYINESLK
jgi:hypothetical protein